MCTKAVIISKLIDSKHRAGDKHAGNHAGTIALRPNNTNLKGLMKPDIQALIAQQRAKRNNDTLERQMKLHSEQIKQLRTQAPDVLRTIAPEAIKLDLQDLDQLEALLKALEKAERRAIKASRDASIP